MLHKWAKRTATARINKKSKMELRDKMGYKKYNWVGNRIDDNDMCILHERKEKERIPITEQIAEAVKEYVARKNKI